MSVDEPLDTLAARIVPPLLDETLAALAALPADVMPDAVKPVRKLLGKLRDHLDLFAPVYPVGRAFRDPWAELRAAVDEGYGVLGELKDLYDTQQLGRREDARYHRAELRRRRAGALAWRDRFIQPVHAASARRLVRAPAGQDDWRQRSGLSPRFWGPPGPRAKPECSGPANLARLARYRLHEAQRAWARATRLRRLHRHHARAVFHDARKRARALARMLEWFPGLSSDEAVSAPLVERLAELVVRQGKILDRINARRVALQLGDDARADALADDIVDAWSRLRRWARRHELDDVLRRLRRTVRRA